jgi:hypothetical protein
VGRRASVALYVDARVATAALRSVRGHLDKRTATALKDSGRIFVNAMVNSFGPRFQKSDEWLTNRTGTLRRSFGYAVSGSTLDDLKLNAFSAGVPYANLQEYGGTIVPKKGKYLTIPIADNLTKAGVPRYPSAADLRTQLGGVGPAKPARRGRKDKLAGAHTFVLKSPKTGKLFILLRKANGKTDLLWALVTSVRVPARMGFRATWARQSKQRAEIFGKVSALVVQDAYATGKAAR